MKKGIVTNIQRYSLNDGDGIRTIVFLKGCPLRCKWCSNPETQKKEPQIMFQAIKCIGCLACRNSCEEHLDLPAHVDYEKCTSCGKCAEECPTTAMNLVGNPMSVEEVLEIVEKDRAFYQEDGGLTLSGGEALMQWEFAAELAKRTRERYHLPVAIETTGCAPFEHLYEVTQYCDQILFDVKNMNEERHKEGTGISNRLILENLKKLAETAADRIIIRIPLIVGFNADRENIEKTCEMAKKLGIHEIHLLPYHKFGEPKYEKLGRIYDFDGKTPDEEMLEEYRSYLEQNGFRTMIGG